MTTQTTTYIAYWMDRTSEPTPAWIISLEDGDSSTTLRALDADTDEADVRAEAERIAAARGLRVEAA